MLRGLDTFLIFPQIRGSAGLSRSVTRGRTRIYHVYKKQLRIVSLAVKGKFSKT